MASFNIGVLIILGLGMFGGTIGARLFERMRIPSVAGYILMGMLIGDMGFGIITAETVARLNVVNLFALGIIGFLVGTELRAGEFRGRKRQLLRILLCEGLGAFVVVGFTAAAIVYWLTQNPATAAVAGIVLGAIATATDPGATAGVLWESRARGAVTTTVLALVALDDALAMALYGISVACAHLLTNPGASIGAEAVLVAWRVGGAVALGVGCGVLSFGVMRWLKRSDQNFVGLVGTLLLMIGLCATYELDSLLATLSLGVTLANLAPRQTDELMATVRSFSAPIYALFVVLVGARLNIAQMPGSLWILVGGYLLARCIGKIAGVYLGARAAGAEPTVRNYAGFGLVAQGGLAVGLAVVAGSQLEGVPLIDGMSLGDAVVYSVTAAALLVQIVGPWTIRQAVRGAGEEGRDITEQDVIESWKVADAMTKDIEPIRQETPLSQVFRTFGEHEHLIYPVTDREGKLRGVIGLDDLKEVIASQDTWQWVLAADVMTPARDRVSPATPLKEALEYMHARGLEEITVVGDGAEPALGILDERTIRIRVNREVLKRRDVKSDTHR